jgi:hypothetical protein
MNGQTMIDEAMDEIQAQIDIQALWQIEHDLIEAEIAEIGALKNQIGEYDA